jgi:Tol biopolymer transport system component
LKPDWSPDGGKIVFERQVHHSEGEPDCGLDGWGYTPYIWLMNADGTGLRRLKSDQAPFSESDPSWSPDGRFIAYSSVHNGLYVIDSEGAGPADRITVKVAGLALSPVWSPDGTKLLFLAASPPSNKLAVVDLASGATQVLSFPTVQGLLLDPAWSR